MLLLLTGNCGKPQWNKSCISRPSGQHFERNSCSFLCIFSLFKSITTL